MGCCILAAVIIGQLLVLRRRLAAWLFGTSEGGAADRTQTAAAWRLSRTPEAQRATTAQRSPSLPRAPRWRLAIGVIALTTLGGYFATAHAEHLRDWLIGGSSADAAIEAARCSGSSAESRMTLNI